ncbi:unnamed protein product [Euphydryas editha]|uniref:Uncharacterized protein n=1 Tax=Euphydryas editha TaxID=104508 RepID=A0AAU9UU50_EUPED|nr:unnamed protein product [Euphydryas editha]
MQLINKQRYKIIIADEPEVPPVSRGIAGLYIPVTPSSEGGEDFIRNKEIEDATNNVRYYFEREWSDDSQSDTESEDDDYEYDWTPPSPIPVPVDDFEDDLIDEDELQELIAVLDKIFQTNPSLLNDPRPVIDVDVYKYGTFLTGSDELVWEFEYCIHEDPTAHATG